MDEEAQRFVNQMPLGMASLSWPDRRYRFVNDAYVALMGRGNLVGRTVDEAFPDLDVTALVDAMDRVHTRRHPETLHGVQLDAPQGTRHVDVVIAAALDAAGQSDGIHLTLVDVTYRHRPEEAATPAARPGHPVALPAVPTVDVAASYLPAEHAAGGDWFDVAVRADGRVALVVGDVVGHGPEAAAVMQQLRAVLRDRLLGDEPLEDALHALDTYARSTEGAVGTSVCVVELDPESGDVEYCTAGHPPPLVVVNGETGYLECTGAGLLGSGDGFPVRRAELGLDDLVVLYTDGLLERPGRTSTESAVEVRQAVAAVVDETGVAVEPGDRAADRVTRVALQGLVLDTGHVDDVTMLAGHRVAPLTTYRTVLAAEPESVSHVRDDVGDWLDALGISGPSYLAVQHAVGELVSNAVLHAYAGDRTHDRTVDVEVSIDAAGVAHGTVRDRGRWRDRSAVDDSRGLTMVRGLVEDFDIRSTDDGTTATFRQPLSRLAVVVPGLAAPTSSSDEDVERPFRVEATDGVLRLSGPVDVQSAHELRDALLARSGQGVRVDLSGVSHLGSVGVRVLSEALAADPGTTLVAPPGSVAQHVLEVVRLPYAAPQPAGP